MQQGAAMPTQICIRRAELADGPAIRQLIHRSMRSLGTVYYASQEAATLGALAEVDGQLIADGTYYVAEAGGQLAGAGGWSRRLSRLFWTSRDAVPPLADPARDPAILRMFFVDPAWTRRGVARALFAHCEAAARGEGFKRFALLATSSNASLYSAYGFRVLQRVVVSLPGSRAYLAVEMVKEIGRSHGADELPHGDSPGRARRRRVSWIG
jgi:N-acetylglutamate synthase-like GNAT family acetyltransferase